MIKKNYFVRSIALLSPTLTFLLPHLATAQTKISIAIPGSYSPNNCPGAFIANFYQFSLLIGGLLAFGVIVYGGIKYMTSAGNPSGQSDAKEWIEGALLGLLLLAGAYFILTVVNPQLVNLNLPGLGQNGVSGGCGAGGGIGTTTNPPTNNPPNNNGACPISPLPTITDPQAQAMENGQTIIWTSSISNVQQNLTALRAAYGRFQTAIRTASDSATVSSVYRPLAYQAYLYAIYQSAIQLQNNPSDSSITACGPIISALQSEEQKHGICNGAGHPCLVGAPTACAPHVAGIGIDMTLTGPVSYSSINATLQQNNVGLHFQGLPGDPVHFQLISPPGGSCANSS